MFGINAEKLEKLAKKNKAGKLTALTENKDQSIALMAIDALGKCMDEGAYNNLVTLLHNTDDQKRIHAAKALAVMGRSQAKTHMKYQYQVEKVPEVKEAIAKAMASIKDAE